MVEERVVVGMAKMEKSSLGLDHREEDGAVRLNRKEEWLRPEGR